MEEWELIKRLLAAADGSDSSFMPKLVANRYVQELSLRNPDAPINREEIREVAAEIAEELQGADLIRLVSGSPGHPVNIAAMMRTEFGEELYQALRGHNVVKLFEAMHAEVDAGEIRRILHQLDA